MSVCYAATFMNMGIKIYPSLLAADSGRLADGARIAEQSGADGLHIDIMDGHFVPNLSMGPDVVRMARKTVAIPLGVHLMITNPDFFAKRFIEAGGDAIQIHVEVSLDIGKILSAIRASGARAGITVNPDTPVDAVFPYLDLVDEILCMSVYPGYGGQKFIGSVVPKIAKLKQRIDAMGFQKDIIVDGGINADTGAECAAAGANVLVAGAWLYSAHDMTAAIRLMREKAERSAK